MVPAVAEVFRPHAAHIHISVAVRHADVPPQAGQTNPPGQRNRPRYSTQAVSSGNHPPKLLVGPGIVDPTHRPRVHSPHATALKQICRTYVRSMELVKAGAALLLVDQ